MTIKETVKLEFATIFLFLLKNLVVSSNVLNLKEGRQSKNHMKMLTNSFTMKQPVQ